MCAGSLALQMHGLQRVQTSLGIQPLAERPRNGFPHPLQDLRDVHRVQASLLRPSVHGPRHTTLHDMCGSFETQGLWGLPPNAGQEEVPGVTMDMGIKDEGIPQLVPAMHQVPHLYQLQGEQTLGGLSPSFVSVHRVWRQQRMRSVRTRTTTKCVSSIAMETRRGGSAELGSTLHGVPLLRDVQPDQKCTSLQPQGKRLHRVPAAH